MPKISKFRARFGFARERVAEEAGLAPRTLAGWDAGESRPTPFSLALVQGALQRLGYDVSMQELEHYYRRERDERNGCAGQRG